MFKILGDYEKAKTFRDIAYFKDREIFLDCRGEVYIDQQAILGFNITILTYSHDINHLEVPTPKKVIIKKAFIASNVVLYNCEIGENSIVACGSVVRGDDVECDTMVAGNPARVIAHRINQIWRYI